VETVLAEAEEEVEAAEAVDDQVAEAESNQLLTRHSLLTKTQLK
jgi:hypothetical protein